MSDEHFVLDAPIYATTSQVNPPVQQGNPFLWRPQSFQDYVGQKDVCERFKMAIQAARIRKMPLDHCLLYGPPGVGKTTLAAVIAYELQAPFKSISAPILERPADLIGILMNLEEKTVLFIDEIHRLPAAVEEILYSAMEDGSLTVMVGQSQQTRSVKVPLVPFTLIGATTRPGAISQPLRQRFAYSEKLDYYTSEELKCLIETYGSRFQLSFAQDALERLALQSRYTPRLARQLVKRLSDYALVYRQPLITLDVILQLESHLGLDELGLTPFDRLLLLTVRDQFQGGPVGLDSLASILNLDRRTLEEMHEPYLVQQQLLRRTSRGRVLTEKALQHIQSF